MIGPDKHFLNVNDETLQLYFHQNLSIVFHVTTEQFLFNASLSI